MYARVHIICMQSSRVFFPARIDIAGGWSDTPPQAYENGGKVCTIAIKLKGKVCACTNQPVAIIKYKPHCDFVSFPTFRSLLKL